MRTQTSKSLNLLSCDQQKRVLRRVNQTSQPPVLWPDTDDVNETSAVLIIVPNQNWHQVVTTFTTSSTQRKHSYARNDHSAMPSRYRWDTGVIDSLNWLNSHVKSFGKILLIRNPQGPIWVPCLLHIRILLLPSKTIAFVSQASNRRLNQISSSAAADSFASLILVVAWNLKLSLTCGYQICSKKKLVS